MEEWKEAKGLEGKYEVSNVGRVKSLIGKKPKIMGQTNGLGYQVVNIEKKPRGVHRMVAEAFIPNPESKPFVNHINGDRRDNIVTNLEWVTPQENITHSIRTGASYSNVISVRKKVAQYDTDGNFIAEYESINAGAKAMNAEGQHGNLRKVCNGKRSHFCGYIWKFI
jgi:hypothetical protein